MDALSRGRISDFLFAEAHRVQYVIAVQFLGGQITVYFAHRPSDIRRRASTPIGGIERKQLFVHHEFEIPPLGVFLPFHKGGTEFVGEEKFRAR